MIDVRKIGKYNVDYCGVAYDGKYCYEMINVAEFDQADKPIPNSMKVFYFTPYAPEFKTEEEIDQLMTFNCYQKFKVERKNILSPV